MVGPEQGSCPSFARQREVDKSYQSFGCFELQIRGCMKHTVVCPPRQHPTCEHSPSFLSVKLREAEERARQAFAAMEAKRQEQAKQFSDSLAGVESEEMVRIEALEVALREQGHGLKDAIETGHRTNTRRSNEIHAEVKSLESRLRTGIADAQEDESARVGSLLRQAQEQVNATLT